MTSVIRLAAFDVAEGPEMFHKMLNLKISKNQYPINTPERPYSSHPRPEYFLVAMGRLAKERPGRRQYLNELLNSSSSSASTVVADICKAAREAEPGIPHPDTVLTKKQRERAVDSKELREHWGAVSPDDRAAYQQRGQPRPDAAVGSVASSNFSRGPSLKRPAPPDTSELSAPRVGGSCQELALNLEVDTACSEKNFLLFSASKDPRVGAVALLAPWQVWRWP